MTSFTRRLALGVAAGLLVAGQRRPGQGLDQGPDRRWKGAYPPFSSIAPDGIAGRASTSTSPGALRRDEGRVHAGAAGLGRHHPGPAGQEVRRHRGLDVDHRGAQAEGRLHQEVLSDAGPVRGQERAPIADISKEALAGKKVGVQRATTHDSFLTDNFGDAVEVVRYAHARTRPISIWSPGASTCCSADSVTLSEGLLKTDQGKDFAFVGPAYSDPKWFGLGVRDRDPQVRQRSARPAQRGDRRDPGQRHLGQDRGQVLRLRRLRQLTCRRRCPTIGHRAPSPPCRERPDRACWISADTDHRCWAALG